MRLDAISANQSNNAEANLADKSSRWNSHNVVVADRAYQNKQNIAAGVGPQMFDDAFKAIALFILSAGVIFAAATSTVSVGIATKSLSKAVITGGAICGGAFIVLFFSSVLFKRSKHVPGHGPAN